MIMYTKFLLYTFILKRTLRELIVSKRKRYTYKNVFFNKIIARNNLPLVRLK